MGTREERGHKVRTVGIAIETDKCRQSTQYVNSITLTKGNEHVRPCTLCTAILKPQVLSVVSCGSLVDAKPCSLAAASANPYCADTAAVVVPAGSSACETTTPSCAFK